jgi:hypothetical protein
MLKVLFLLMPLFLLNCGGGAKKDAQATPEDVVNTIFDAAKNKDYSKLSVLCAEGCDGDSKHVCEMKDEDKESFVKYFSKGKVVGSATVEGDNAKVNILFGPDGTKEETMNLVKKDGKWYLMSF